MKYSLPLVILFCHKFDHDCLLNVQAVFSLFEDLVCVLLEYVGHDLLAAVCGQTMLYHNIALCNVGELFVDAVSGKCLLAHLGFALLTH